MPKEAQIIDHLFRKQYAKMVAILTGKFGIAFLETAEDIVQETMLKAANAWSYGTPPANAEAWLMKVAMNMALNHLKREKIKERVYKEALVEANNDHATYSSEQNDDFLAMIFACAHPAIGAQDQVAIVLKILCGFSSREIADALLSTEAAIDKRIYRAKQTLRELNIELKMPKAKEQEQRLDTVCTCLYLVFNRGYNSRNENQTISRDICLEAMALAKMLLKDFSKVNSIRALSALMCFHAARFDARLDDQGAIILLKDQDRTLWNQQLITTAKSLLAEACQGDVLTSYHLEALIAHEHCRATSLEDTDWQQIFDYYQALYAIKGSVVIQLNMAILRGKIDGPQKAIEQLTEIAENKFLKRYYLFYATLAYFEAEVGEKKKAIENYHKALQLTRSTQEQALIKGRIEKLMI